MKTLLLMTLLSSFSAFASDITCINVRDPRFSYHLTQLDNGDRYQLVVTKETLVPGSERSRWGRDYTQTEIFRDTLNHIDVQGTSVFESKRVSLTIEDPRESIYTFAGRNAAGEFVTKYETLNCE